MRTIFGYLPKSRDWLSPETDNVWHGFNKVTKFNKVTRFNKVTTLSKVTKFNKVKKVGEIKTKNAIDPGQNSSIAKTKWRAESSCEIEVRTTITKE